MCCLWWPDEVATGRSGPVPRGFHDGGTAVADRPRLLTTVTVPLLAWLGFAGFVVAMLVLDLFVLHRRAREVSLTEAGAAARFRYLQPGLAVILAAVAVKLLTTDVYELPVWASPSFIAAVLAVVAAASVWDTHHRGSGRSGPGSQDQTRLDGKSRTGATSGTAS